MLREPLRIPRASLRAAVVERDDRAAQRFRVHTKSGPFVGRERDGWLWERGRGSAVPALMRGERDEPNVALILEPPVLVPRLRGRRGRGPLAGERLAGLLLRVDNTAAAEAALDRARRPAAADRARRARARRRARVGRGQPGASGLAPHAARPAGSQRTGWLLLAGGAVFPLCGFLAAVAGLTLWHGGPAALGLRYSWSPGRSCVPPGPRDGALSGPAVDSDGTSLVVESIAREQACRRRRPRLPRRVRPHGRGPRPRARGHRPRRGGRPGRLRPSRWSAGRTTACPPTRPRGSSRPRKRRAIDRLRRETRAAAQAGRAGPRARGGRHRAARRSEDADARRAPRADLRLLPPGARAGRRRSR